MNTETTQREAYNYTLDRDRQGELIEWMKTYASTEITREDQASMNCGIFTDLEYMCNYLGDVLNINPDKAYLSLCIKGRNQCYHKFKSNNDQDVFSDIANMVSKGKRSINSQSKMATAAIKISLFNDVISTKFHTTKQTLKIGVDESRKCGIKTSHLNLYWTLTGLKYMSENESAYFVVEEDSLIDDVLRPLRKADKILNERKETLDAWMAI